MADTALGERLRERLADRLGEHALARNHFDITDEATTFLAELPVEDIADWLLPVVTEAVQKAEAGRDAAEAEAHNLGHDYDRRGDRLWRLAALAGHVPHESDNDATAELVIADAITDRNRAAQQARAEVVERIEAEAAKWKPRVPVPDGWDYEYILRRSGTEVGLRLAARIALTLPGVDRW